jgi:membrane fusion protein (multidrug efflux system)
MTKSSNSRPWEQADQELDKREADQAQEATSWWLPGFYGLEGKHWRRITGAGLAGMIAVAGFSIANRQNALEAYITGDLIEIKSPIQGTVSLDDAVTGALFEPGKAILVVTAGRQSAQRNETLRLEIQQLETQLNKIRSEQRQLLSSNLARIESDLVQAESTTLDLQGQAERYQKQAQRYQQLVKVGAIDSDTLAGSLATYNSFQQRLIAQKEIRDMLRIERTSARKNLATGSNELPRSGRRLEILELEISRLTASQDELTSQLQKLRNQLKTERQDSKFEFRPGFPGVVISNRVAIGEEVGAGSSLLSVINCQKQRVEALFESGRIKKLKVGDPVSIIIPSTDQRMRGVVTSLRGEQGLGWLDNIASARFRAAGTDKTRVQVSMEDGSKAHRCHVGEKVDVEL